MLTNCKVFCIFAVSALQVAKIASEECTWPKCVYHCKPCQHAILGDCEWTVLNLGASCPKHAGETQCLLGQCTCGDGDCPVNASQLTDEDASTAHTLQDGAHHPVHHKKQHMTCTPQICVPGARPEEYHASFWTRIFSGAIGNPNIPDEFADAAFDGIGPLLKVLYSSEDVGFSLLLILWPSLLILAGIAVTAEMLYSVECKANVKIKEIMANHMQVTYSEKVTEEGNVEAFHMDDAEDFHHSLHVELDDVGGISKDLESNFGRRIEEFLDEKDLKGHFFQLDIEDMDLTSVTWPGKLPRDQSKWPMICHFEPLHHDYVIKKPHSGPMLVLAIFTAILAILFGMVLAHRDMADTMSYLDRSLGDAHSDAVVVAEQGEAIRKAANGFNSSIQALHAMCHFNNGSFIGQFMSETTGAIDGYNKMMSDIQAYLESAPSKVHSMHQAFRKQREWLELVPLLPTILITILCGGMVVEAVVVRCTDKSAIAHDVDITLRLAAFLFAVGILAIAFVGALECLFATFLSLFCMDVDHNVVQLVQKSNVTEALNITRHYVLGDVLNPIMENVYTTDKMIFDLRSAYSSIPVALEDLGEFIIDCPVTQFFHVSSLAKDVSKFLQGVAPLFDNTHIYPYYKMIIRDGMCGSFVDGIGWILLAQLVVGIVCFPLCVYFTHQYLTDCFIWEWAKEHAQNSVSFSGETASRDSSRTDVSTFQPLTARTFRRFNMQ